MSKNTRWALALVGAVIVIVAAVVIGTGDDDTKAVQEPSEQVTPATDPSGATSAPGPTDQNGATGTGNGGGSGTGDSGNSGGAGPDDSDQDSGGASPSDVGADSSGGAKAQTGVVSPIFSTSKVRTVSVDKGETVTIRGVSESDGEMHVHGYDKTVTLKSGRIARVKFKANIDGEFPIEFHLDSGGHADVGTLRVNP
ncbi:MAG: hypothetical protein ACSLFF_11175 [Solirubrobacterales bacterium]